VVYEAFVVCPPVRWSASRKRARSRAGGRWAPKAIRVILFNDLQVNEEKEAWRKVIGLAP
jgi:hypothetical protein